VFAAVFRDNEHITNTELYFLKIFFKFFVQTDRQF